MKLPNDPAMLLSVVNTQLRDHYSSLLDFASAEAIDARELEDKLAQIDYRYDSGQNQFV